MPERFGRYSACYMLHVGILVSMERPKKNGSLTNGPEYLSWRSMKSRCLNPKATGYKNYGGRGITVCERWMEFLNFYADMGPRPEGSSLDRIDTNGNYEPGNVRWGTASEQVRNRRKHENSGHFQRLYQLACNGGHLYTNLTTYFDKAGKKHCRICHKERERHRRERGKEVMHSG